MVVDGVKHVQLVIVQLKWNRTLGWVLNFDVLGNEVNRIMGAAVKLRDLFFRVFRFFICSLNSDSHIVSFKGL